MILRLHLATTFWRLDESGSKVRTIDVNGGEIIVETIGWDCDRSMLYLLPDGTYAVQAPAEDLMNRHRAKRL